MFWFLLVASLLVVIATVLSMFRFTHWFFRGMDFPRLQIAAVAALLLFAHLVFIKSASAADIVLLTATGFCLLWQLWWVMPYTVFWKKEVRSADPGHDPQRELSIITANVLQPNRSSDKLIALVRQYQPDILVTLESNTWWEAQLSVLEETMPYTVKCPLENLYGMHLYSRLPFEEEEVCFLVEDDIPSIHIALTLRTGDKVRMHFVHPAPPSPTENEESAERDAELIMIARSIANSDNPVVVTGDLNDVAWSVSTRLFRKISGLLDPRVGRGMYNTFHVQLPFLRWPLDHLFHSKHFTLRQIKRLPSIGSDHFSLYTALVFDPPDGRGQEGLEADVEDQQEAREITAEMGVSAKDVPTPAE